MEPCRLKYDSFGTNHMNGAKGVIKMRTSLLYVLVIFSMLTSAARADDLTVIKVIGHSAVIGEHNTISNLKAGDAISNGNTVVVLGKGTVHMASPGNIIVFKAGDETVFKFNKTDPAGKHHLGLTKGRIDVTVVPGNKLDVNTPHMVASVRGTEFSVAVDEDTTCLTVDQGLVQAVDHQNVSMAVKAGHAIQAAKKGFAQDKPDKKEIIEALIAAKKAKIAEKKQAQKAIRSGKKGSKSNRADGKSQGKDGGNAGGNAGGNGGGNGGGKK